MKPVPSMKEFPPEVRNAVGEIFANALIRKAKAAKENKPA